MPKQKKSKWWKCRFHVNGVPPEWRGPFFSAGCTVCEKKLREGLTTRDAPVPEMQPVCMGGGSTPRVQGKPILGGESFRRWLAGRPKARANRANYYRRITARAVGR